MRIGIFFGGPSREREISYLGGKTAYQNLDKQLFVPVLVFVDSLGNFILVDESKLYHEGIRDFYPAQTPQTLGFSVYIESLKNRLSATEMELLIQSVGTPILPTDFSKYFDFAFIILHGPDCEDGAIQGLMEWYKMPYMGPGLLGSSVGIDKIAQNEQIARANGQVKKMQVVRWQDWNTDQKQAIFEAAKAELGLPIVVKAPHQGSSIGVAIVKDNSLEAFSKAMGQCFFALEIDLADWHKLNDEDKHAFAQKIANLNEGIAYPVTILETNQTINHPADLVSVFNSTTLQHITILSANAEDQVLLEEFIEGQEFSCGVIQDNDGTAIALPPTEIAKASEEQTFDFVTKYKSNTVRKHIPVQTNLANNQNIQRNIKLVFEQLGFCVVTRIDGFLTPDDRVLLHDPNTLPGMSPASLIFKQMAEIGLNVSQSITYFIRQSIRERIRTGKGTIHLRALLTDLDSRIAQRVAKTLPEQDLVFEANDEAFAMARQTFSKLNSAGEVRAVPMLKISESESKIVPLNLMFKDRIEDLLEGLDKPKHPLIVSTIANAKGIIKRFGGSL